MFEELELDRRLRLGLAELPYTTATEVQEAVVPPALAGTDLLVSAATGSGKTLAYLVPLVQRILSTEPHREPGTLGLVMVPTRELARQVVKVCAELLQKSPLRVQAITGGADFKYQRSLLRKDPEIIVATPGRMREHCEKGSAELGRLQTLVIDEADRMLDMGMREDALSVAGFCPAERQVLLLSATLSHRGVGAVAQSLQRAPQTISLVAPRTAHADVQHQLLLADNQAHKDALLLALLGADYRRALVFANKRRVATRLSDLASKHGLKCAALHGEMRTEERKHVVQQFHDGRVTVLCASDVAARGLDVEGIDLVINYDMPRSGDDYVHRTGRTGRAGEAGRAVSLVEAAEWNLMISIRRYLQLDFERITLPGLKARYNGPKNQKSSGKAAGRKKKDPGKNKVRKKDSQGKTRARKRATRSTTDGVNDGFAPLTRKKKGD